MSWPIPEDDDERMFGEYDLEDDELTEAGTSASAGDAVARKHKIGPVNANSETIRK